MTDLQARIRRELAIAYDNGVLQATGQSFTSKDMAIQVGCDMIARSIREALSSDDVAAMLQEEEPAHADH